MRSILALAVVCALAGSALARVVVVDTTVEILDPIRFVGASASLTPQSQRTLDAIARTLIGNPSIKKLEVVGFGNDAAIGPLQQIALGDLRARAIIGELVRRGVEPMRLQPSGKLKPEHGNDPVPLFLILVRSD